MLFRGIFNTGRSGYPLPNLGKIPRKKTRRQASNIFQNDLIVDENGKPITFNSMVDAMNYMGKLDWEFVQAYIVTEGNQNIYHWLMKRAVKLDEKGGYVPLTRKDYKKAKANGN